MVDCMIHVGDPVLEKPQVEQLRSLEATKAMKGEIVVRSAGGPAFTESAGQVCAAQWLVHWRRSRHGDNNAISIKML